MSGGNEVNGQGSWSQDGFQPDLQNKMRFDVTVNDPHISSHGYDFVRLQLLIKIFQDSSPYSLVHNCPLTNDTTTLKSQTTTFFLYIYIWIKYVHSY